MGRRPCKHACRHGNIPGKAQKGRHRRAQEHACVYGNTPGLMGGWSQVHKCKHKHTWRSVCTHKHMSTNMSTQVGMQVGEHAGERNMSMST